jgi:hypothetical protein
LHLDEINTTLLGRDLRKQHSRDIRASLDVHNHESDAVSRPLAESFDGQISKVDRVIQTAAPVAPYEDRLSEKPRHHVSLHRVFASMA